jgi:hypothetical protein
VSCASRFSPLVSVFTETPWRFQRIVAAQPARNQKISTEFAFLQNPAKVISL